MTSAPASITAAVSAPRRAKSADRRLGAMRIGVMGLPWYDDGLAPRPPSRPSPRGEGSGAAHRGIRAGSCAWSFMALIQRLQRTWGARGACQAMQLVQVEPR